MTLDAGSKKHSYSYTPVIEKVKKELVSYDESLCGKIRFSLMTEHTFMQLFDEAKAILLLADGIEEEK